MVKPEVYLAAGIQPRPLESDESVRRVAIEKVMDDVISAMGRTDPNERDGVLADLMGAAGSYGADDGYKIAKSLDANYGWDCDLELVEILDQIPGNIRDAARAAVADWVKNFQVSPCLPIGEEVTYHGNDGIILNDGSGKYESPGCYVVRVPSKGHFEHMGYVVAWEEIDGRVNAKGPLPATIEGPLFGGEVSNG
jgi:hypothetical protein